MDIFDKLINTPQIETSGSNSASRFAYQRNWALGHLMNLHIKGEDYVFAFEFHDDILVMNSETLPSKLSFFQVKTKERQNWTIPSLTSVTKDKNTGKNKLSILGKLYHHKTNFQTEEIELSFVTNTYFSFHTTTSTVSGVDLDTANQTTLLKKINNELPSLTLSELSELFLVHGRLSLEGHENHIKGEIHSFFKTIFGEDHNINIEACYKTFITEIAQRNDYPQSDISNRDDFFRNKCITKSYIEKILDKLKQDTLIKPKWDIVSKYIQSEVKISELIKIEKYWHQFATDKLNSSNFVLQKLDEYIKNEIQKIFDEIECLNTIAINIMIKVKTTSLYEKSTFPDSYIKAMVLWSYYEYAQQTI